MSDQTKMFIKVQQTSVSTTMIEMEIVIDTMQNPKSWLEVRPSEIHRLVWSAWLSACLTSSANKKALTALKLKEENREARGGCRNYPMLRKSQDLQFFSMHGELLSGLKFCSHLLMDDPFHVISSSCPLPFIILYSSLLPCCRPLPLPPATPRLLSSSSPSSLSLPPLSPYPHHLPLRWL